jgi:hypothetical protein
MADQLAQLAWVLGGQVVQSARSVSVRYSILPRHQACNLTSRGP